jgi:uncharacterized protein
MNIISFGWPDSAYENPTLGGGFTGLNKGLWILNQLFFDGKMMTTFSMLFGAGLVLMDERATAGGRKLRGVYYRRVLWLIAIGLLHSYFIWAGDILVLYGECGLLLYPFRKLSAKTLIIVGVTFLFVLVPVFLALRGGMEYLKGNANWVDQEVKEGRTPTEFQRGMRDFYRENLEDEMKPDPEKRAKKFQEEIETYRGGYWGIVKDRAKELWIGQTIGFILGGFLFAGGRMLIGMGLMKLGVFSAERSRSFYIKMMAWGYGIGLPLEAIGAWQAVRADFGFDFYWNGGFFFNFFSSLIIALGHVGMIMLIYQSGAIPWLTQRLAAVGRMALSNYLTHSIVCTLIFYGYGLGYFATMDRISMMMVVLSIWIAQLVLSPIWLEHFRYGPAEWLWRSLTYWKWQPMRRETTPAVAV